MVWVDRLRIDTEVAVSSKCGNGLRGSMNAEHF
jgi:hypothetical protein